MLQVKGEGGGKRREEGRGRCEGDRKDMKKNIMLFSLTRNLTHPHPHPEKAPPSEELLTFRNKG